MKTIIIDIDGTITNMWPIEKSVLLYMTDTKLNREVEKLKSSGVSDTYKIFLKICKQKVTKKKYVTLYNKSFSKLFKKNKLPIPKKYPLVKWIFLNKNRYHFVYATGGQKLETLYVLKSLGLYKYVDFKNSIDNTSCPFSKKTGIPFKKIKSKFKDCILISDSKTDYQGATLAQIPCILIKPTQKHTDFIL